jgi:nitrite reductase/ring-hydroxylating ferredoxin subunit
MTEDSGQMVLCTADPLVVRRLEAMARELGFRLVTPRDAGAGGKSDLAGDIIVFDLDAPGVLEEIVGWRESHPEAFLAGHLGRPDPERWTGAERAGCDLVVNRGALVNTLRRRLAGGAAGLRRRRFPLLDTVDVAGRLGLVHRDPDSPVGPLAVYHIGGRLFAVEDRCPHAGAVLSGGELEGPVLTCPAHGSQFDVRDGDRCRGPADVGLKTFPLLEEGGRVYLLIGPAPGG